MMTQNQGNSEIMLHKGVIPAKSNENISQICKFCKF